LAKLLQSLKRAKNISYFNSITHTLVVSYRENEKECTNIYVFEEVTLHKGLSSICNIDAKIAFAGSHSLNFLSYPACSAVDPHHLDVDPDTDPELTDQPNAYLDADPDSDFYLMRMRIRTGIRLFTFMRIMQDPDTSLQVKAQTLEKVLK
jgi:hypothetical protein